jgi:4-hydroxy-tetrahydrodipicolinate reductase
VKLAIVGYGKMGQLIEQLAPEYGCEIVLKLDEFNNADFKGINRENFTGVDAAIEFSTPHTVVENVRRVASLGVNLVVGATGWKEQYGQVEAAVKANNIGLVWSPNFSIGVNVFMRLVAEAARAFAPHAEYGPWAWEIHHDAKKDAPSGTLLALVERMKKSGFSRNVDVSSNRAGRHPGTHEIGFDSAADTVTLRHTARSREGFARGALQAAQWVRGKQGIYEFSEVLFG